MIPSTTRQMQSTVHEDGHVHIELAEVSLEPPARNEVIIRMEASPINPSDLGTMFAGADLDTVAATESGVRAQLSDGALRAAAVRLGTPIPLGNEGAGIVVAAGGDADAQALLGRTVAVRAGAYTQFRRIEAAHCLVLAEGTPPAKAASCFVNPLTALGMVDTMRLEGHSALVHTAAASNLGQMLVRICVADDVPLVNIVRSEAQAKLLHDLGATYVCDMTASNFDDTLAATLAETGATLGFDATGGGALASRILAAMERALSRGAGYSRYGSTVHKQVYLYGSLQAGATQLNRSYGMAWGVGGWLLTNFLTRVGPERARDLMNRVASELDSTFASGYTQTVSLAGALEVDAIAVYGKRATGEKFLIAQAS